MRFRSAELLVALWFVGVGIASLEDRASPLSRIRLQLPDEDITLGNALTVARGLPSDGLVFLLLPLSFKQFDRDIPREFAERLWPRKTAVFFGSLSQKPREYMDSVAIADRVPTFIIMMRKTATTLDLTRTRRHAEHKDVVCYAVDWSSPR
ncbi:MAG: hypothetical protein HRU14_00465 [Planctomycetes bacterium]|nr:hypothetical protein [Planctomycetota bacterium]